MAKKTSKKRRAAAKKPPLGPDEYLSLNNEPARQSMPKKLAAEVETRRVSIHVAGKGFDPRKAIKSAKKSGDWEIELPSGSGLVLPGRRYGRMSPSKVARGIKRKMSTKDRSEPFRPRWVDYKPHPKVSTQSKPLMQRLDGRKIEPHYGVFGPDDRQVYYPSGYPWMCVGKVLVWNDFSQPFPAWSGSGVLIGGRVVLTAGHMAP